MACGLPVVAADSGGPTESIIDLGIYEDPLDSASLRIGNKEGTGLLRPPIPDQWRKAVQILLGLGERERQLIAENGRMRVDENFSAEILGRQVEEACIAAVAMGDLHGQLGDKLIWGGAGLMLFAAVNLGLLLLINRPTGP